MNNLITALLTSDGKLSGRFQRGDYSDHLNFNPATFTVMTELEFYSQIEKQNSNILSLNEIAQTKRFKSSKEMLEVYNLVY